MARHSFVRSSAMGAARAMAAVLLLGHASAVPDEEACRKLGFAPSLLCSSCTKLEEAVDSGKSALLNEFADACGGVMDIVSWVAGYAPIVGQVLTVAHSIYEVVENVWHELPAGVDDFLRQVATAHRLLRAGFKSLQLTRVADQHTKDLLGALEEGQTKCEKIRSSC